MTAIRAGKPRALGRSAGIVPAFALGGCTQAPMIPLFGAYFPGWLLCALVGVVAAVLIRVLCILCGLDAILSFRLFTYLASGTVIALLLWSVVFGP